MDKFGLLPQDTIRMVPREGRRNSTIASGLQAPQAEALPPRQPLLILLDLHLPGVRWSNKSLTAPQGLMHALGTKAVRTSPEHG